MQQATRKMVHCSRIQRLTNEAKTFNEIKTFILHLHST